MNVVVEILPVARGDLIALLLPRTPTTADAVVFGHTYLEDIERQFIAHEGLPPDARQVVAPDGTLWWWRYVNGIWVVYRLEERRRGFGGRLRRVTIVGFEAFPPLP